jgi:hypothetical protein
MSGQRHAGVVAPLRCCTKDVAADELRDLGLKLLLAAGADDALCSSPPAKTISSRRC